jgi:Flp pilus assembly protein TadD
LTRRVPGPRWGLWTASALGLAVVVGGVGTGCGGASGGPRDREAEIKAAQQPELPPLDGKVDDELRIQLAELLIHEGAHENAVPIVREALARKPQDARLHYLLGTLLRDRGVYDEAERELRLAVDLEPKLAPAQSALGILYDLQQRGAEAERHHRIALSLDETAARFHNNLGFNLYLQGRHAEAIAAYEAALKRAPTAQQVYMNLGFAYAALGREADAARMFRQAGSEADALTNLALAHELQGQPDKARTLYQKALLRDPRQSAAQKNLEALETTVPASASVAPPPAPEKSP